MLGQSAGGFEFLRFVECGAPVRADTHASLLSHFPSARTNSFRRSSESSGIGKRMIFPSTAGVDSDLRFLERSLDVLHSAGVESWTTSKRGSGVVIKASCFNFMADP